MGRRQYLQRLALGRSAYEDDGVDASATAEPAGESTQQYDSKGRPINPAIDEFNAEQRRAKNEVLELVGVVERKTQVEQADEIRYRTIQEHRQAVLKAEQERGELLESLILPVGFLCHLWPEAFRQRIQIGLYDPVVPMADVLSMERARMWNGGWRWWFAAQFPALGDTVVHALVRLPLILVTERITRRLQKWIGRGRFSRKTREMLYSGLSILYEVVFIGIDILVLPMEYYACTQRLGLTPALPLLPPLHFFHPFHPASFHNFGWKPLLNIPMIKSCTSPAALLLVHKFIHYDADDTAVPLLSLITDFRHPSSLTDPPSTDPAPRATHDPIGWLLHHTHQLPTRILHASGWTIIKRRLADDPRRTRDATHEADTRADADPRHPLPVHRSTTLAHQPALFLAESIAAACTRVLTLPFESLVARSIALSWGRRGGATTPMPGATLFVPFASGPLARVWGSPGDPAAWAVLGRYASRIGLALALTAAIDTVLFFGVHYTVRYIGTRNFDWGRRGRIGQIIYSEEGLDAGTEETRGSE
jgi:hypothetical protein